MNDAPQSPSSPHRAAPATTQVPFRRARIVTAFLSLTLAIAILIWRNSVEPNSSSPHTSTAIDGASIISTVARFTELRHPDGHRSVLLDRDPIFTLKDDYLGRFRFSNYDDHWLGTSRHPVNLAWLPNSHPRADKIQFAIRLRPDGFTLTLLGEKPDFPGLKFTTTLTARTENPDDESPSLTYELNSKLVTTNAPSFRKTWAGRSVEYLDPWIEAIFWPQREGRDHEIHDLFLFTDRTGKLLSAPKLHVFPSIRDATYETLVQPFHEGARFAVIDPTEPGCQFTLTQSTADGEIGICWWTWDPHFMMTVPPNPERLEYTLLIEPLTSERSNELRARATPIPFQTDPDYQLAAFSRDAPNRFDNPLDHSDEWAWEPHSSACSLDPTVGHNDSISAAIATDRDLRTAWYTRCLGEDYFDHRRLAGGHRISAKVRTQNVARAARLALICYNGPETWLYEEPDPLIIRSQPLSGTRDWTTLELRFNADGYKRFKLVLEQEGPGRSWFDDVEFSPDPTATSKRDPSEPLDLRDQMQLAQPTPLPLRSFNVSRPRILESAGELTLAWADSTATSPPLLLHAGLYRLHFKARGTGCPDDPPIFAVTLAGKTEECRIDVTREREFTIMLPPINDRPIQISFKFINDGRCDSPSGSIDKNVFIQSITLTRDAADFPTEPLP